MDGRRIGKEGKRRGNEERGVAGFDGTRVRNPSVTPWRLGFIPTQTEKTRRFISNGRRENVDLSSYVRVWQFVCACTPGAREKDCEKEQRNEVPGRVSGSGSEMKDRGRRVSSGRKRTRFHPSTSLARRAILLIYKYDCSDAGAAPLVLSLFY